MGRKLPVIEMGASRSGNRFTGLKASCTTRKKAGQQDGRGGKILFRKRRRGLGQDAMEGGGGEMSSGERGGNQIKAGK